jgi:hypothetical protein
MPGIGEHASTEEAVIPPLGRLRKKDHKFKASLSYVTKPCLK